MIYVQSDYDLIRTNKPAAYKKSKARYKGATSTRGGAKGAEAPPWSFNQVKFKKKKIYRIV